MIIVLHGDNQVASRNRLVGLREDFEKKGLQTIFLNGKTATPEQINIAANTGSLLGGDRLVIVEEFFSKDKKAKESLALHLRGGSVIFWEGKELSKTLINSFPKHWSIEIFNIQKLVFKFLDNISPGKSADALKILHKIFEQHEEVYAIPPLIAWHTRYLIWAKVEPDTLNIPPWRKSKLTAQAAKFEVRQLYNFHQALLNLDRDIKTSRNFLSSESSLDLLIANL